MGVNLHNAKVNYDGFDCNGGKPPEPNTTWNHVTNAWEWNDLNTNTSTGADFLPAEAKEALDNNICLMCGKKNCPYIREYSPYKQLREALNKGDKALAKRIYWNAFGGLRKVRMADVKAGLQKARDARNSSVCTVPYTGPIQHKRAIATPGVWSEWIELLGSTGSEQNPHVYTVNFNPTSNMESSFDVEIKYTESHGVKTINTMGPGSYTIKATGGGNAYIRVKSHSVPVTVTFDYPK